MRPANQRESDSCREHIVYQKGTRTDRMRISKGPSALTRVHVRLHSCF